MADTLIVSREEAAADSRPQPTPGLTRAGRRHVARRQAKHAHRVVRAHVARTALGGGLLPSNLALIQEAQRQLGKRYRVTGCRCSDSCPFQDCSGLICGAAAVFIPGFTCTSSFGLAILCRNAGTLISEAEAIWTPGAIGIENAWGTSNGPNGTNGHVVFMDGNGLTTTEEMGTAYGCCHGHATGRGFNAWAKLPGFAYGLILKGDGEMILQTLANGSLKPSPIDGRHAGHFVSSDGTHVVGTNGGSIDGDSPAENEGHLVRHWYPMPVGPGQSLSIARRANNTGLIAVRNDGVEVSGDYS